MLAGGPAAWVPPSVRGDPEAASPAMQANATAAIQQAVRDVAVGDVLLWAGGYLPADEETILAPTMVLLRCMLSAVPAFPPVGGRGLTRGVMSVRSRFLRSRCETYTEAADFLQRLRGYDVECVDGPRSRRA